jgi:hypothetical protein
VEEMTSQVLPNVSLAVYRLLAAHRLPTTGPKVTNKNPCLASTRAPYVQVNFDALWLRSLGALSTYLGALSRWCGGFQI